MADNDDFFNSQTPSSLIKAKIVAEYFPQYARIISRNSTWDTVRYVDLFSGPGIYDDGNPSTPLLLGSKILENSFLREKTQFWFNDNTHINKLRDNFTRSFPLGTFANTPKFTSRTVGEDAEIDDYLRRPHQQNNKHPTLLFYDPFGYKTVDTTNLIQFMRGWANELFLFVNSKRINPALDNPIFEQNVRRLLPTRLDLIRNDPAYSLSANRRLTLIIANLKLEFESGLKPKSCFCQPFQFIEEDSTATSHYLFHVTKDKAGFSLIKEVYSSFDNIGASLDGESGTYTFDAKRLSAPVLDFGNPNIELLRQALKKDFAGKTIDAQLLYDRHHVKKNWSSSLYLLVLRSMAEQGELISKFTDTVTHQKRVFLTKECILTFKM